MVTVCAEVNVPADGLKVGVAATEVVVPELLPEVPELLPQDVKKKDKLKMPAAIRRRPRFIKIARKRLTTITYFFLPRT
jgi:hypothetical protein